MSAKFDPSQFFGRPENVALNVPASEVFGLLTRSLDLPDSWAALVTREAGDRVLVPAGRVVQRAGAEDVMFVRVSPVAVTIELDGLASSDGYQCQATVDLRVSVIPETGDLESFQRQVLGSHRVVQVEALGRYLEPGIQRGLSELFAKHNGKELAGTPMADTVRDAVVEALKGPCFSGGLGIEGSPTIRVSSSALRSVRDAEQEATRRRAEHEVSRGLTEALGKARDEHLDHLADLLGRLRTLATDSPDLELPELIRTFTERQRGELYEALFATEPAETATKWIVAAIGHEVLFFDPQDPSAAARRVPVTGPVGAARSVQVAHDAEGKPVLWLGAATGVYRLPIDASAPDLVLSVPEPPAVRGGFNAVAVANDRVFASHSELGLYEWSIAEPEKPVLLLHSMTKEARTVRSVCTDARVVYCAMDDRIVSLSLDGARDVPASVFTGSTSAITAVRATTSGLYAGNSNGDVLHWRLGRDSDPETVFRGGGRAVESLWHATTHGVARLIFSDTSICVRAQVLGDSFVCRYEAGGQTLRRVEVAPDLLVATNDLRDRLFCWTPGRPTNPRVSIPVSRMSGQSVQDFCLV